MRSHFPDVFLLVFYIDKADVELAATIFITREARFSRHKRTALRIGHWWQQT
jgi:hypothetical protein